MQKVVLYMGIAITVLMVLFPPWTPAYKVHSSYDPNQVSTVEEPTQYRFMILPRHIPGRLPITVFPLRWVRLSTPMTRMGFIAVPGQLIPPACLVLCQWWATILPIPMIRPTKARLTAIRGTERGRFHDDHHPARTAPGGCKAGQLAAGAGRTVLRGHAHSLAGAGRSQWVLDATASRTCGLIGRPTSNLCHLSAGTLVPMTDPARY